jgi:hypothetical protein
MTGGTLFWIIVYCCATLLFFCVALVIAVLGVRDLRDLLSSSGKRGT